MAFLIFFFSNIPIERLRKDRAQTGEQENYLLKSLLGNFQDGGLRARLQALARPCQTTLPLGPEIMPNI